MARPTVLKEKPKQKRDYKAKEPISEKKSSDALCVSKRTAMPFVAPDVDVIVKSLIQFLVFILNQISTRFFSPFS